MNSVVATGFGPVSSIGIGREEWLRGMAQGRSGISPLTLFAAEHPTAEVVGLDLGSVLPSAKTYLDRASEFSLAAAQLALLDAGMTGACCKCWRYGVVLGSQFGCLATMQTFTSLLMQKGPRLANPLLFSHMYVNTPTSLAAIEFAFGGHHATYTGKDAGMQALEGAVEALQLGRADMLIVIGVDAISEPLYRALVADGSLGDSALGEGACALVLETAQSAEKRGVSACPLEKIDEDSGEIRRLMGVTHAAEPLFALGKALYAPCSA